MDIQDAQSLANMPVGDDWFNNFKEKTDLTAYVRHVATLLGSGQYTRTDLDTHVRVLYKACRSPDFINALIADPSTPRVLVEASRSSHEEIKTLVLHVLSSMTSESVEWWKGVGDVVLGLLFDESISVSEKAAVLITRICSSVGVDTYFDDAMKTRVNEITFNHESMDIMRVRYLSLMIRIASHRNFEFLKTSGHLDELFGMVRGDPLIRLVALELLEELGRSTPGRAYMSDPYVLEDLWKMTQEEIEDPSSYGPHLSLICVLCENSPAAATFMFYKHASDLLQGVRLFLEGQSFDDQTLGLGLWSCLMATREGRESTAMKALASTAANQLKSVKEAVVMASADAWRKAVDISMTGCPAMEGLLETSVIPIAVETLIGKPFPETRRAIYNLLTSLTPLPQIVHLLSTPRAQRVLLEREQTTDTRVSKHSFLVAFLRDQRPILDAPFLQKLDDIVKQGPHHQTPFEASIETDIK